MKKKKYLYLLLLLILPIIFFSVSKINLKNSSSWEGKINSDNIAKSASLSLDSSSKIKLTGDSYLTTFEDEDSSFNNIDFNGYMIYVNGEAIK